MKEIFEIMFDVSMLAFVAGSMVALGLGLTISETTAPFKDTRILLLALFSNFVVVPLFAFALVWLFPVSDGVRIGIILLSLGGGAPFIPKIVESAKGKVARGGALMLLLIGVTILFMPVAIPIIFPGESVSSWQIAKSLIFVMLIPLVFALLINARFPNVAARIQPLATKFTNIAVLVLIIAMLFLYTKIIIASISILPIVIVFFLGAAAIGYVTGGKNNNARFVLAVGTGLRNPPVAILVASHIFPNEPVAATVPLFVMIIGAAILFPWAKKIGKNVSA